MKRIVYMALPQEQSYTIEDIYALPEGIRAELIDGKIYYMAPPSTKHQRISGFLHSKIYQYISTHNGTYETFTTPFSMFLSEDNKNYVEPDISVICDKSKLTDKGCVGAPDWIIEIVSSGSRRMDYFTKLFKYRTAGVKEYWLVDSDKNRILVYNFENEDTQEFTFSDIIKAGIYTDLSIDFSQLNI